MTHLKTMLLTTTLILTMSGHTYAQDLMYDDKASMSMEAQADIGMDAEVQYDDNFVRPALELLEPTIKKPAPGAKALAGLITVVNNTDEDNAIIAASSEFSEAVELHTMSMENDVMSMRKVEKIVVPANGEAVLSMETGDHLMYINPVREVNEGDVILTTLTFENGAQMDVEMIVMGDGRNDMIEDGAIDESAVDVKAIEGDMNNNSGHSHGDGYHQH